MSRMLQPFEEICFGPTRRERGPSFPMLEWVCVTLTWRDLRSGKRTVEFQMSI